LETADCGIENAVRKYDQRGPLEWDRDSVSAEESRMTVPSFRTDGAQSDETRSTEFGHIYILARGGGFPESGSAVGAGRSSAVLKAVPRLSAPEIQNWPFDPFDRAAREVL
jgi:hypothetical protein